MRKRILPILFALAVSAACTDSVTPAGQPTTTPPNPQTVSVLTQHNENTRSGWNSNETVLNTSNVDPQHFGKVFAVNVDDQVYAQPLVVGHVSIDNGQHNVVLVATVNNTVYAFDGDNGKIFWQKNYTVSGMRAPRNADMTGACDGAYRDFSGAIGIVGTPVIDSATATMYFVARSTSGSSFVQHLHAINIVTGAEVVGSPVQINATVSGTGDGNVNGVITFNAQRQNQRQALTLVNGVVYVTFASHCDWGPYHGWVLGYAASSLQRQTVYNLTPNGYAGGVWESGTGMAADAQGNLFVVSGNGSVGDNGDPTSLTNRAESALKLTPSGATLRVASYFTPYNYQYQNDNDVDYGGMGAMLIPGTRYLLTGDKAGFLFMLSADDMGGFHVSTNQVHQTVRLSLKSEMHCQPAYFKSTTKEFVYIWPENEPLRGVPFNAVSGLLDMNSAIASSVSPPTGHSGAVLSVSSDGSKDGTGIVWAAYAATGDAEHDVSQGVLRAFDATDVSRELWSTQRNGTRDGAGAYAKFSSPTIANGHVYLPTFSNQVVVYGLQ